MDFQLSNYVTQKQISAEDVSVLANQKMKNF